MKPLVVLYFRFCKFIFFLFFISIFANCNSNAKNFCDPSTSEFLNLSIVKSLLNDSSPSCGLNWANTNNGSFTLGGTISGLIATGLVLSSGTTPNQTVSLASRVTTFQFANALTSNSNYAVTASTQPVGQTCRVSSGSGNITANVNSVLVTCTDSIVATPVFSPAPGNYTTSQSNITITTTTPGATIYYTTDGSIPTTASTQYTTGLGHIWFLAGRTLRAFAVRSGFTDSNIASAEYSYIPLKSGQSLCHNSAGNLIGCASTGQDGEVQLGVARGYTNNGDGTVTDNATGLLWQRCSLGLSDANCSTGSYSPQGWSAGQTQCTSLTTAGKTWRLPSRYELETLPDYGIPAPTIDAVAFPATDNNRYLSITKQGIATSNVWHVFFNDGALGVFNENSPIQVRCVSGETQSSFTKFVDNGNGTILDKQTGLIWQKCSVGQTNITTTCSGGASTPNWTSAFGTCTGLGLASRTWRLPNVQELKTIFDVSRASAPTINITFFPGTVSNNYWSSTTYRPGTTEAWVLDFSNGNINNSTKTNVFPVRCVSGP